MDSNYFEIQLKKGEIDYSLQSLDDSLIIQAISHQQIKWETTLNNQNFRNNLKIDRDEIDWEQIKLIIEEIFKNNYKSSFSEDSNQNILKIECEDSNIKKKIGDLVIELKKTKNTLEKFKRIEEILLQMDSPLTRKILTKVKKLKNVFVENELVSYNLENENSSLKKQNQVFKQEIEKPKSSDQNEKIMEPKEEIINIELEMLKVMKRQLDKLESIDFQIQQNKKLIEYQNSLKLQMKQEKMKMKNLKMMKIIGMENSCLPLREMFILKNFLREAGVLNEKSFLNLVYVASKHGYSASDFHKYSDHKPKNIILIKANDFIFGGYSPVAWGSKKGWVECKDCFIFSLSNPCNLPLKMNCKNPTKSIYDFTSFGPIFGGGSDIYISDNCNLNNNSYSDPGCSYDGCPFPFSTKESKTFFCGTANFKVQEIEVYQIFQIF